jgi:hypothetical protein
MSSEPTRYSPSNAREISHDFKPFILIETWTEFLIHYISFRATDFIQFILQVIAFFFLFLTTKVVISSSFCHRLIENKNLRECRSGHLLKYLELFWVKIFLSIWQQRKNNFCHVHLPQKKTLNFFCTTHCEVRPRSSTCSFIFVGLYSNWLLHIDFLSISH